MQDHQLIADLKPQEAVFRPFRLDAGSIRNKAKELASQLA